jgi:signal transduction histidine kinase
LSPDRLSQPTRRLTRPTQRLGSDVALAHLAALERLDKIINAFASVVSHETRTALVGIQGLSELIRDGDLSAEEMRAHAEDIFSEAQKVNAFIGEVFDLNRLETGQTPFRTTRVDVNRIVGDIANRALAKAPRAAIELNLGEDRPMVSGDPDRLRQAIENVLSFVVAAAKPGTHVWVATLSGEGTSRVSIRFNSSLKDAEFDDWLMGRYERYEQRPSAMMGAGLGLAIARAIIELNGGRIGVETSARSGTEFQITLTGP